MDNDYKKKRRNCADRARYTLEMRKARRGRKIDPAMSVGIQLMAIFSIGLRLLPDFSPAVTPVLPMPVQAADPLPTSFSEPWQRYRTQPSWVQLIRDLARPVATLEAQREVRSRLPAECGPWLDKVFLDEDWSSLRMNIHSGATDEEVAAKVLHTVRRLRADRAAELAALGSELSGGAGGASFGFGPGTGGGPGTRK